MISVKQTNKDENPSSPVTAEQLPRFSSSSVCIWMQTLTLSTNLQIRFILFDLSLLFVLLTFISEGLTPLKRQVLIIARYKTSTKQQRPLDPSMRNKDELGSEKFGASFLSSFSCLCDLWLIWSNDQLLVLPTLSWVFNDVSKKKIRTFPTVFGREYVFLLGRVLTILLQ